MAKPAIPKELRGRLEHKRLIFAVTPGRSGTGLLAERLSLLPGVYAGHEAPPDFVAVMRTVQKKPEAAIDFWIRQKLPAIAEFPELIYAETSHLFCKGFVEPLLELGIVPDLILLSRAHREVALSLWKLKTIPSRSPSGVEYLLSPDDPGVLPLPHWQRLHDYQLCYWYCLEIERRMQKYGEMLRKLNARVHATTLNEIASYDGFERLIGELQLPEPKLRDRLKLKMLKTSVVNAKTARKHHEELNGDVDAMEQEVKRLTTQGL